MTRGTACGKVILLGEHAVVYGVPAIAVGIDRGADAVAEPASEPSLFVRTWGIRVRASDDTDLARAFQALSEGAKVRVEASADLPAGAGLGCSAALGVAIARALDPRASADAIAERVMAWERVFHGNPSGVDATVAAHGAAIVFRKGSGFERIDLGGSVPLCVGLSGMASSTRAMVELVAQQRERRPDVVRKTFEGIGALVANAKTTLAARDLVALGKLLDLNHMLLAGLMLSTPEIEQLCSLAREAGAFGAKVTGAGGGGAVVALVSGKEASERVLSAWRAAGFEGFYTEVRRPAIEPLETAIP